MAYTSLKPSCVLFVQLPSGCVLFGQQIIVLLSWLLTLLLHPKRSVFKSWWYPYGSLIRHRKQLQFTRELRLTSSIMESELISNINPKQGSEVGDVSPTAQEALWQLVEKSSVANSNSNYITFGWVSQMCF